MAAVFGNGGDARVLAVLRDKGAARIIVFNARPTAKASRKGMEEREACRIRRAQATPMRRPGQQTTPVGMYPACPASVCDHFRRMCESGPGAETPDRGARCRIQPGEHRHPDAGRTSGHSACGRFGMLQCASQGGLGAAASLDDAETERTHELSFDMRSIASSACRDRKAAIGGTSPRCSDVRSSTLMPRPFARRASRFPDLRRRRRRRARASMQAPVRIDVMSGSHRLRRRRRHAAGELRALCIRIHASCA